MIHVSFLQTIEPEQQVTKDVSELPQDITQPTALLRSDLTIQDRVESVPLAMEFYPALHPNS